MRDYELPNVEREAVWRNVPTGRAAGTITLIVRDAGTGVVVLAADAAVETTTPGTYLRSYITPATQGLLLETWTDTVTGATTTDELEITHTAPASPSQAPGVGLTYASVGDLRVYAPGSADLTDAELNQALVQAESDVNAYIFRSYAVAEFALLLPEYQRTLRDATCAQAEFRLYKGADYFVEPGVTIQGPDFTITGSGRWFSYKAARILKAGGLSIRATRAKP